MIRLRNHHPNLPFRGWVRTTTDDLPQFAAGQWLGAANFVVGRATGLYTRIVDIHCDLAPGQALQLDFAQAEPWQVVPSLPPDLVAHFGGELFPVSDGVQTNLVSLQVDGAALLAHFRASIASSTTDLWVWWYPDEPAWCHGEVLTTYNPDGSALFEASRLRWGDAVVHVLGARADGVVSPADFYAHGQARAVPITFTWARHCKTPQDFASSAVAAGWQIGAVGISKLLHDGNPHYAEAFQPSTMIARFGEAARRLHTWDPPLYGPSIRSADTGDQEDQTFVRGEALLPGGEGAELVAWMSAIALHSRRPCNYLEADGSPLDPDKHPQLLFWDAAPHSYQNPPGVYRISPDQLGKSRRPTIEETRGYYGPDIEHFLANTLAAACRLTGSPVAQRLLRNLCVVYLLQRTENPSWSVSTEGNVTRAIGWEGIFVVHVWRDLEDREMAQRVADRWRARASKLILPLLASKANDIWDVRTEPSASLPVVPGWMPWQQAVAAYGVDLACRVLGPSEGCAIALRGAKRVVEDVWQWDTIRWRWEEYERLSLAGDRSRSGYYDTKWLPCAPAVVLRYEPEHGKARFVWDQIKADSAGSLDQSWLPPMG